MRSGEGETTPPIGPARWVWSFRSRATRTLRRVIRPVYHQTYRAGVHFACMLAGLTDRFWIARSKFNALPPPLLRYKVAESVAVAAFVEVGRETVRNLEEVLARAGRPLGSFQRILDFGCGCGRTLIWLSRIFPDRPLYGTDADHRAVAWCERNLNHCSFTTNSWAPPLPYRSGSFDLVYALSVFTHLDQASQSLWLVELNRILKPGGVLLVTVHGDRVWEKLEPRTIQEIRRQGHLETDASRLRGIYPDWYRTSFHTRDYVLRKFAQYFDVVEYFPEAMGDQDVVICRVGPAGRDG